MCSPSQSPLSPPTPSHPSESSLALVSCIKPGLVICFTLGNIYVSMLFSLNITPSPSPTESRSLFYTSVSLFLFSYRVIVTVSKYYSRQAVVTRKSCENQSIFFLESYFLFLRIFKLSTIYMQNDEHIIISYVDEFLQGSDSCTVTIEKKIKHYHHYKLQKSPSISLVVTPLQRSPLFSPLSLKIVWLFNK